MGNCKKGCCGSWMNGLLGFDGVFMETQGGRTATDVFAVEWIQTGIIHFGTTVSYFGFVSDEMAGCVSSPETCVCRRSNSSALARKRRKLEKRSRVSTSSTAMTAKSSDKNCASRAPDPSLCENCASRAKSIEEIWFNFITIFEPECDEDYLSVQEVRLII